MANPNDIPAPDADTPYRPDKKITPKKNLGRGIEALLTDIKQTHQATPYSAASDAQNAFEGGLPTQVNDLPISQIETNPFQPRLEFNQESLQELADSIAVQGVIQPITVRRLDENTYQLIAGERRLRAAQLAGLTHIPAYIRTANDEQMLEMALIENIQRQDLNPIETALAYKRLMDECKITLEQVGERVGKKRPTINNYIRLLKLPPDIQAALRDQSLSMGHARALLAIDSPVLQLSIFREIVKKGLSVRQTEELVRSVTEAPPVKSSTAPAKSTYQIELKDVERRLTSKFNTRVKIDATEEGKGVIKIAFYSTDDLNRLLETLE